MFKKVKLLLMSGVFMGFALYAPPYQGPYYEEPCFEEHKPTLSADRCPCIYMMALGCGTVMFAQVVKKNAEKHGYLNTARFLTLCQVGVVTSMGLLTRLKEKVKN